MTINDRPTWDNFDYPYIAKLIWRFARTGIAGGASSLIAMTIILKPDWSNSREWLLALSSAFISGFIATFFKTIRDVLSEGDKSALIQKLPI